MKTRMTLWIATIIMSLFAVPPEAFAEQAPDKSQVVTVDLDNATLKELFKTIESQTYYHFSYLEAALNDQSPVTIHVKKTGIDKVLDMAFKNRDLQYKIVSNNTIVVSATGKRSTGTPTTVTGTITDSTGEPIVGATIKVKGTNKVAVSNIDGQFSIQGVNSGAALTITYIGYNPVEVKADGKPVEVTMQEAANDLDEVVVVGYSRTTKRDLISSVSTVKSDQIVNLPVTNVTQGLAGRSPGLIIASSGGGVNQNPSVSIRGGGTPLYVIDGVIRDQGDFTTLSPDDIKEISVLKDASATAIYGSRAANGIIQVTTKTGSEGKTSIDYSFNASWAQPGIWPDKLPVWDRAELFNTARFNDGYEPFYSDDALAKMRDGSDPEHYPNTDWRKAVLRDWAPQMKHQVRLTGGTEQNRFYISLGHIDQQSLYKTNTHWMKRTNFRIADNIYMKQIGLHVNASIDGYYQKQQHPYTSTSSGYYGVFSHVNNRSPLQPAYNKYGLPMAIADNPASEIATDAGYARNKNAVINGKGEIIWDCLWVDGLSVRYAGNYRFDSYTTKNWRKDAAKYDWDSTEPRYDNVPQLYHSATSGYNFTNQIFVEYNHRFGKHSVTALAGYEDSYSWWENGSETRVNYQFPIDQINIGPDANQSNSGDEGESGRAAWIGQLKYSFDGRYLVEGSIRHDGSDSFAPGKRWGTFYSGSLGWRITQEEFMRDIVERNIFNNLKLRASYGETGLDSAGRFEYLTSYTMSNRGYVLDGEFSPTFSEGSLPSPDLSWYSTKQTDIGIDFSSLNSRLYGSADYFYYTTKGYLVAPTGESYLNQIIGISMPKVKSDTEFRRAGWEFQVGFRDNFGDLSFDVSANLTLFNSLYARIADEAESSYMNPYIRQQQHKQNFYGSNLLHAIGYYGSADEVYNSPAISSAINSGYLRPGDLMYEDTNGDGQITSADYRRRGHQSTPHQQYGINISLGYKGFYLTALFQGSGSFDMMLQYNSETRELPVIYEYQSDAWTPDNTGAMFPRLASSVSLNGSNNYQSSDFWLVNGRYIRLKDLQFGYDFKHKLLKRVNWLSTARLGISGQNLFTISEATKYGLDPENSSTLSYGYPIERVLAFSLNLGF